MGQLYLYVYPLFGGLFSAIVYYWVLRKAPCAMQYVLTNHLFYTFTKSLQSCPTLCNPMGSSLPGFSVHGILQERILERVADSFSRGSSQIRDRTHVSHTGKQILYN